MIYISTILIQLVFANQYRNFLPTIEHTMEKTPLLQSPTLDLPFIDSTKQPPPSYGIIHVPRYYLYTNIQPSTSQKRNGLFSLITVGVVLIALALIAYFCLVAPHEKGKHTVTPKVLRQSPSFLSLSSSTSPPKTNNLDLDTPQGRLRGYTRISRQGREYTAFYKVPYAEPPLNSLRFKDPIAPQIPTWSGIRDIPTVAPQCIQKEKYAPVVRSAGEEDCLYANIYVPTINEGSTNLQDLSLPAMVYIHGGGVSGNGSRYGADYFMDEDVIIITFQYRLGAFGFLNTEDDVIHGNMGLKDQVQMLIWVRDYIKYYGGDNTRVTIFGNSVGGMHTGFLVLSPMATGLFHRAISQSGANLCTSVNPQLVAIQPLKTVQEVGNVLNCSYGDSTAFRDCLLTKDAEDIAVVLTLSTEYAVSVERRNDDQVFMPDTPYNVLKSQPNKIPYIIGVVNSEWIQRGMDLISDADKVEKLNKDLGSIGNDVFVVDLEEEDLLKVKEFYFGGKEIGNDTYLEAIKLISDRQMNHCCYTSARMNSEYSPTYLYYLSKPPALSYVKQTNPGFPVKELDMVSHGDELQYLFHFESFPEITKDDPVYFQFSAYLIKLWATFAATGNPYLNGIEWKPVNSTHNSTFWLELNDNPGRTDILQDRMDFWDQFTHKQLKYDI